MNAGVALLGLPFDAASSFLAGASEAPATIRQALHSPSTNLATESGRDLGTEARFRDLGNLDLPANDTAFATIEERVGEILDDGVTVLALGGDHSVTLPLVRAHARRHGPLNLLQLDAHPDLYESFEGRSLSHATTFARILEAGLATRLVQLGIRTINPHQREQARRWGVEVIEMKEAPPASAFAFDGPVYLSLDLDVVDPAFAPGVSHPEPGGASVREVLGWIQRLRGRLVGADLVELNPRQDPSGLSARVAAKFVKEIADRLFDSRPRVDERP